MLTDDVDPPIPAVLEYEPNQVWLMQFDGSSYYIAAGAGIFFIVTNDMIYPFSYRLGEFPCTNNMAEYEALLLGLKKARKMGVKSFRVEGDSELIVKQVRKECEARHLRMRKYMNAVWDEIELFDAFNISHIGREINREADALARSTTLFDPTLTNPYIRHRVELYFSPHILDNITAMQVFDDEEQILNFMHGERDFSDCLIDEVQDGKEIPLIQLRSNHIPAGIR
jgi:ribonuclease HI